MIEDVIFKGPKKEAFETLVNCYACNKPFMVGKWLEHREICEKVKIECACGMEIIPFHTLADDGSLKGKEYSQHMTAHDMHIWYECDKVYSICMTCGFGHYTRGTFSKKDHECKKFSGQNDFSMEHRYEWYDKRMEELEIGKRHICRGGRPLVRHY